MQRIALSCLSLLVMVGATRTDRRIHNLCREECRDNVDLDWAEEQEADWELEEWRVKTYCSEHCVGCAHYKNGVELMPRNCTDTWQCGLCGKIEAVTCVNCEPFECDQSFETSELPRFCNANILQKRQVMARDAESNRDARRLEKHAERDEECDACNEAMRNAEREEEEQQRDEL